MPGPASTAPDAGRYADAPGARGGGYAPPPYEVGYDPAFADAHDARSTASAGEDAYDHALAPGTGRRRAAPAPPAPDDGPDPGTAPAAGPPPGSGTRRGRRRAAAAGEGPAAVPAPRSGADRRAARRRRAAAGGPAGDPAAGAGVPADGAGARRAARAAAPRGETWRRLVPQALVVAVLAGGTSAFVASDKAIRLTVDGTPRTLHTFADDVGELLAQQGVGVGDHDLVAPAPGDDLADGDEVVVRYGRPVLLTLDGTRRRVWTTARTVEAALRQLGIRAEGAYLSAARTAPITRDGMTLSVRTERTVTFLADGRERTVRTNAATVREALEQAGITLQGQDTTSVPPASFPRDGQTVTVLRITGTREVREELVPYATERVEDDVLFAGTEVVDRAGRPGARRVTYTLRTVNGVRQKPRRVAEEVIREPVTQKIRVGTRPLPTSVAGADGLDWGALAHCESGGRPGAVDGSGTYGGLYQFDVQTWQALGGSGRPQDAPAGEQTFRAKKLYVQRGASPWPHCGRRLTR
ncbi:ubiquitin-like domain-containing protein [Streptomyces sp. NPDC093225]|uniref:ubiquitin-like domain-containing protein n=1 Tax=Streptomyces sp. NPDC093225 TaxID=3366034 RepID=UPI00382EA82F